MKTGTCITQEKCVVEKDYTCFAYQNESWQNWEKCNVLKSPINDIKVSYIVPFAGGVSTLGTYDIFSSGDFF